MGSWDDSGTGGQGPALRPPCVLVPMDEGPDGELGPGHVADSTAGPSVTARGGETPGEGTKQQDGLPSPGLPRGFGATQPSPSLR